MNAAQTKPAFPGERNYSRINPAYFDAADVRIQYLAITVSCLASLVLGDISCQHGNSQDETTLALPYCALDAHPTVWYLAGKVPCLVTFRKHPTEKSKSKSRVGQNSLAT
jgi:hypothetical protein